METAEEIDIKIYVDGEESATYHYDSSVVGTLADNTQYSVVLTPALSTTSSDWSLDISTTKPGFVYSVIGGNDVGFPLRCWSPKITIEATSVLGAGQNVAFNGIVYSRLKQ